MDRRTCECDHKAYDHLGAGRCNSASKRCRCTAFRECTHPRTKPWGTQYVCTVCNQVTEESK